MIIRRFLGAIALRLVNSYDSGTDKVVMWDPSTGELVEGPLVSALGGRGRARGRAL